MWQCHRNQCTRDEIPHVITILPVSGGSFPSQLAMMKILLSIDFKCDIFLAASGGNVATYLCHAGHWTSGGINQVIGMMSTEMFVKPWNSFSVINLAMVYFQGSLYKKGNGCGELLHTFLTPSLMGTKEIWTGTYNTSVHKPQIFCNRSLATTILPVASLDIESLQILPPVYCDNDIDRIAPVVSASASIPGLVSGQYIDGDLHVDGGMGASSPFILLQDAVYQIAKQWKSLHLYYLGGCDLNAKVNATPDDINLVDNMHQSISNMIRTMLLNDRSSVIQLLKRLKGSHHSETSDQITITDHPLTTHHLYSTMREQLLYDYTVIEIYPLIYREIDITSFTPSDIHHHIEMITPQLHYRFYR